MLRLTRDRATTAGFMLLAFVLAFWQKPGWAVTDTKIDLHVDPRRFLADVASVWTPTRDLGEVHSGQYSGYLWPMGPFYAALHAVGLAPWVVQRLWLGVMLALAAWGMLRLLDVLIGRRRGIVHIVATAFFVLNPYTVVFAARTSITLLGYAALPWLLVAVYHGVRQTRGWRGWWWPAAFALMFTSIGGGINAAIVFWMCIGPLLLLLYQPILGQVRWRNSVGFLLRAGGLSIAASLWWIVPLLVHVKFGIDFLRFTEQPRSIWGTNSVTESLRLMGYWTSYIGVGYYGIQRPFFSDGGTLLFAAPVLLASLVLPAAALTGFAWTRHWRYAPFFLALVIVGVLIMAAGFPDGTPLRKSLEWGYANVFVLRPLRTGNKAAPLVALGIGALLGLAVHGAWSRVQQIERGGFRRAARVGLPALLGALILAGAWPLIRGRALDDQLTWKGIPAAWRDAGKGLDRDLAPNTRAMILPGQIFGFYRWGGTIDAILPRLTDRPVAVRYETPYSDLHAVDLQLQADQLVQQDRLVPGQLRPLLGLMGVSAVVSATDDDISRSGAVAPSLAARTLAAQGFVRPDRSYGPPRRVADATGELDSTPVLPQVRRYDLSGGRGTVGVLPRSPATIVDGSAEGLATLAAFGSLPAEAPIFYAGDLTPAELRSAARTGAQVVVSDSNRRRIFLPQHSQQNLGPTLPATNPIPKNFAVLDPFPDKGSAAQTVAVLRGAIAIDAPTDPVGNVFPEHRPFAAFDGRLDTAWLADRSVDKPRRWVQVTFQRPRNVPYVDVYPANGRYGVVTEVEVNGRRTPVGSGWTRLPVDARGVRTLRIRLSGVRQPTNGDDGSNAGLREVRIPGLRVSELLRPPVLAGRSLAGRDLRRVELTYLMTRTTGDQPFRRDSVTGDPGLGGLRERADGERDFSRLVFTPASRSYDVRAWVNPGADAPDSALDRLAGLTGGATFDSNARFHGRPAYRASSAFDADPATAWIGIIVPGQSRPPWIQWRTARPTPVTQLRITPPAGAIRRPTVVRLSWSGGQTPPLRVNGDGTVVLPRPARARRFRLTILASAFPLGTSRADRSRRAVGIATLRVAGLGPVVVPRQGPLRVRCGVVSISVAGRTVGMRPTGTLAALNAGAPLRARSCTGRATMGTGVREVRTLPGPFDVDLLSLSSAAPARLPAPVGGGRVTDSGRSGRNTWDGVRVALKGPSWLVLGESFDEGWRAACDGRSLGAPQVIDGYANGWRAPADCRNVAFTFAPQKQVDRSQLISAIVCALLALFLLATLRRVRPQESALPAFLPSGPAPKLPLPFAAALGVLFAIPLSFIFALRTGPLIAIGIALILWRGIGPRVLTLVAGVLLAVVVPVMYLAIAPKDEGGGYNFGYAIELIYAHWVGVAAVVLLGVAGWQTIAAARRRPSRGPAPTPGPDSAQAEEPSTVTTTTPRPEYSSQS
jgi:arabinofuranan 3-O-arabinosyltransferase